MSAEFFGFNTTQAKTLDRLLKSDDAGLAALAAAITDLTDRVEALEAAGP